MRLVTALPVLALSLALLGCSSDDSPTGPSTVESAVRVAHLSPDAPSVDVWADGVKVLSSVPFKAVSDYMILPAGSHRLQVTPAGASTPVVIDATVTLAGGRSYTVAATGLLAAGLEPVVLADERSAPASESRVRFVHASPDAPAVDVTVNNGPFVFTNVAFRQFDGYATVSPGTYSAQVRPAGATAVVLNVPEVKFVSGGAYTIFAVGRAGNGTLGAVLVGDN